MTSLGSSWTAGYRSDGLRAWKQNASGRTYYLYDGDEPVYEMNPEGTITATNVFAPDGLVARYSSPGGWTYYTFDAQGDVSQRLDSSQNVISSSTYDAFGAETTTGTTPTDPFGYNAQAGYLFDRDTGLYLCQHRYYDPSSGRWVTRDPIGYGGGIGLYAYCGNSPAQFADPHGKFIMLLVVGAILLLALAEKADAPENVPDDPRWVDPRPRVMVGICAFARDPVTGALYFDQAFNNGPAPAVGFGTLNKFNFNKKYEPEGLRIDPPHTADGQEHIQFGGTGAPGINADGSPHDAPKGVTSQDIWNSWPNWAKKAATGEGGWGPGGKLPQAGGGAAPEPVVPPEVGDE